MTKKTITLDLSFKKWMKIALLAIFFFAMSYFFISCASAQTSVAVSNGTTATTSVTGCCITFSSAGMLTCSSCPSIEKKKEDPYRFWFVIVSFLFLVGAAGCTLGAIITYVDEE